MLLYLAACLVTVRGSGAAGLLAIAPRVDLRVAAGGGRASLAFTWNNTNNNLEWLN